MITYTFTVPGGQPEKKIEAMSLKKATKKFQGGELLIGKNLTIDCNNNTMVLFPSVLKHKVEKVKMLTKEKLCGRFSMTQFLTYK